LRIIAQIAQSVEQGIENPRVGSSILSLGTTYKLISVSLKLQPEQTPLYQLVEKHYPTLVEQLEFQGKNLPTHVHREFEAYLKCGRLEHGFLRVRCDTCHFERLVAFSCKKRGFCPSCGARRMAETAALLANVVLTAADINVGSTGGKFANFHSSASPVSMISEEI
jgi:hypothetical protein